MRRRTIGIAIAAAASVAAVVGATIPAASAGAAKASAPAAQPSGPSGQIRGERGQLKLVGESTGSIPGSHATYPDAGASEFSPAAAKEFDVHGAASPALSSVPRVTHPNQVTGSTPGLLGWTGVTHADQRNAGTGAYVNTQFSLEPPDQALCAGNGYVLEGVNTAFSIYTTGGSQLAGPVAYNQFFGLAPEHDRVNDIYGDFTSDPKCLYDPGTERFFMTLLQADTDPANGAMTGPTSVLIAVSKTSKPTGGWWVYQLDTTNDGTGGTPSHADCPCLGDQPLIGTDAHGFYITTNEFPQFVPGFNGAQIYALQKDSLVDGIAGGFVLFSPGDIAGPGGTSYSVQPATSPTEASYDGRNHGTEWFLSAGDFFGTGDHHVYLWAISSTDLLAGGTDPFWLVWTRLDSEKYTGPPLAVQKDCTPLPACRPLGGADPVPTLNSNDDRMNQVVYANGSLWSGLNTAVTFKGSSTQHVGMAYFVYAPGVSGHGDPHTAPTIWADLANQGYVAVKGQDVMFPSTGVSPDGRGMMSFTLAGPGNYPTAAYTSISQTSSAPSQVHKAAPGTQPADGFTGYAIGGGPPERWGDYSAATWSDGSFYLASEWVGSDLRTVNANWETFVSRLP